MYHEDHGSGQPLEAPTGVARGIRHFLTDPRPVRVVQL